MKTQTWLLIGGGAALVWWLWSQSQTSAPVAVAPALTPTEGMQPQAPIAAPTGVNPPVVVPSLPTIDISVPVKPVMQSSIIPQPAGAGVRIKPAVAAFIEPI